MEAMTSLDGLLLHITAQGRDYDCVSRSFAPKLNVAEDPVCGSGHCHIVPIWAKALGKDQLKAYQASKRGGELYCKLDGSRVTLAGYACLYSIAELNV
jgi:predicted PhzF superfamily epimerase YddE/YHI9